VYGAIGGEDAVLSFTLTPSPRILRCGGTGIARSAAEAHVAENEDDDLTVVPIPASESQVEHDRIRKSNDRDQDLEREGKPSPHNRGYDEAADGENA
jgi:hypothetical protein